ncbi:hypothetical protein BC834DRAFT_875488 [Gloeopeniophorella convolvens]|nr:hypothetical protein BC834DRAFT_875488 [Gloeopeniophorella convolvens]
MLHFPDFQPVEAASALHCHHLIIDAVHVSFTLHTMVYCHHAFCRQCTSDCT